MPAKCNNQGRAFEYACLLALQQRIRVARSITVEHNSCFDADKKAWDATASTVQTLLALGADAAAKTVLDAEPLILEESSSPLLLTLQKDSKGEEGDVRDILISRADIQWTIGLSLKHNHFAVKHSRLAKSLDFGQKWYSVPCSCDYWRAVKPIFDDLDTKKHNGVLWRSISNKQNTVYVPLLQAFIDEVLRAASSNSTVPARMAKYLLGEFDFYKIISIDNERLTRIHPVNLNGTLAKPSKTRASAFTIPTTALPTRIACLGFKPNSNTTVELYMDNGWQFSFRIHSASEIVEPSLKFDIQPVGLPTTILTINCQWA